MRGAGWESQAQVQGPRCLQDRVSKHERSPPMLELRRAGCRGQVRRVLRRLLLRSRLSEGASTADGAATTRLSEGGGEG